LIGEWVVPFPLSSKGNVEGCTEIYFVSPGIFSALSRDEDRQGDGDNNFKYNCALASFE